MTITVDVKGIDATILALQAYRQELEQKLDTLCRRLADYGLLLAEVSFGGAMYDGVKDISVTVEPMKNGYKIVAGGMSVLFVEFGAGVSMGYGHPQAGQFGYGAGTYNPDSPNWNNPHGWWFSPHTHTYGNPPSMSMYNSAKDVASAVETIAREVFA